jgi:hypothetical protein
MEPTSSPMSPPTGIVMSTSCELSPVHMTVLNSACSEGSALVIRGKCAIFFCGGDVLVPDMVASVRDLRRRQLHAQTVTSGSDKARGRGKAAADARTSGLAHARRIGDIP